MYSDEVMKRFKNPKNAGELKDADGVGEVGNIACGDIMVVYIKVRDDKIADVKFKTLGCAAAIATSDMICDLAKGKTLEDAEKLTRDNISDSLGSLPALKEHCSNLAAEALAEAIYDYLTKNNKPVSAALQKKHEHTVKEKASFETKHG